MSDAVISRPRSWPAARFTCASRASASSEVLAYDLRAVVDGRVVAEKTVRSPGLRADRPLSVEEDLRIAPGDHDVSVTFSPHEAGTAGKVLSLERRIHFDRRRVVLITYENHDLIAR